MIPVERITAATFAVCGWKDFYVQGTLDYFRRLAGPKKLLMGPWKHVFPNLSAVEPVNLLEMMVRWWDRWLRGKANEAEADRRHPLRPGQRLWRQEETWPPRRNEAREFYLLPGGVLGSRPAEQPGQRECYGYDPTVGLDSISFDPWTAAVREPGRSQRR